MITPLESMARHLMAHRILAGKSRSQVWNQLGINEKSLVKLENGKLPISSSFAKRFAKECVLESVRPDFEEAFNAYNWDRQCIPRFVGEKDLTEAAAEFHLDVFGRYYELGEVPQNLKSLMHLFVDVWQLGPSVVSVRILHQLSHCHMVLADLPIAKGIAEEAAQISKGINYAYGFAWSLIRIAMCSRLDLDNNPLDSLAELDRADDYIKKKGLLRESSHRSKVLANMLYRERLATLVSHVLNNGAYGLHEPELRVYANKYLTLISKSKLGLEHDTRLERSLDVELQTQLVLGVESEVYSTLRALATPSILSSKSIPVAISRFRTLFILFIFNDHRSEAEQYLNEGRAMCVTHGFTLAQKYFDYLESAYLR